jgi:hypothetical protein
MNSASSLDISNGANEVGFMGVIEQNSSVIQNFTLSGSIMSTLSGDLNVGGLIGVSNALSLTLS